MYGRLLSTPVMARCRRSSTHRRAHAWRSPDGTLIASVDWQAVHVWEPFTGRQVLIAVRD